MPIIEWNVNFLVGIQEIDQQHKELVESLNKTYDEFREGCPVDMSFLEKLGDFSARHFRCEKEWMKKMSYPKLTAHQEEHELFTSRIQEFTRDFQHNANSSVELLWFLCNWVTHHIRETDADFGRFVDVYNIRRGQVKTGSSEEK